MSKTAIEIVEKYLSENFWLDHLHKNGYPTKVMTKSDFCGMLNELKKCNDKSNSIAFTKWVGENYFSIADNMYCKGLDSDFKTIDQLFEEWNDIRH